MLQEWRKFGATTYAGYIIGFPGDTRESVLRDIEIIKKELPLDLLEFFYLTPLPGSGDHKILLKDGQWMDPDLNKYDLNHRVSKHPVMSDDEWDEAYRAAWNAYYTPDHMATILRRAAAHRKGRPGNKLFLMCWFYFMLKFEDIHPLEGGYFRLKFRKDRRPDLPRQNPVGFYLGYGAEIVCKHVQYGLALAGILPTYWRIKKSPARYDYSDTAIAPAGANEAGMLDMFSKTRGGMEELDRQRKQKAIINEARARG